jgi:two-component system phosphate regulon sensor histidine kinase PhoR
MVQIIVIALLSAGLLGTLISLVRTRRAHALLELQNRDLMRQSRDMAAQLALGEALKHLSQMAYNSLILVDEQQHIIYINEAGRALFGPAADETPASIISATQSHVAEDIVQQALLDDEEIVMQLTLRSLPFRVRAAGITVGGKRFAAIALEDVRELQRLGRARRDMVANISHELRTPITTLRLLVDSLRRAVMNDLEIPDGMIHKISAEIEVLEQMAQELLDLSMIESGRAEFALIPIQALDVVAGAAGRFSERALRKALTISYDIDPALRILADPEQIGRVLSNLLHNSIKYTPEEGEITIAAYPTDDMMMRFTITDTGPGIPVEDRERIFERFYRADQARHTEGTGLGLAIAKHIVRAHGGEIWAENPPGGSGAQICFTVPLEEV